jgi:hypothetical protein
MTEQNELPWWTAEEIEQMVERDHMHELNSILHPVLRLIHSWQVMRPYNSTREKSNSRSKNK